MKSRIYIDSWLRFKPYHKETRSDVYYLKLCNRVKDTLIECIDLNDSEKKYSKVEVDNLACFLTSYFEDLISGTNIWNSFVKIHKRYYDKPLPFFEEEKYVEGEINFEDVKFLIWYFFKLVDDEYNYSPVYFLHSLMAYKVMDIFEDEWEYAPENDKLLKYYQLDNNESDFYTVRQVIRSILVDNYLFHYDTGWSLEEKCLKIIEEDGGHEHFEAFMQDATDNFTFRAKTKLLALKGQEWLAEILGDSHPLYNDILNISDKVQSNFICKGQNEDYFLLEHIASGKEFNLTKKSIQQPEMFSATNEVFYLGIVRWKDGWWFSGVYFKFDATEEFMTKERNSLDSKKTVNFLESRTDKIAEILNEKREAFLQFNKGSLIAFMKAEKVPEFVDDFMSYYNDFVTSKKEHALTSLGNNPQLSKENKPKKSDYKIEAEHALVFFNKNSGIEIVYDFLSAFPLPENPYWDIDNIEDDIFELLESQYASTELAQYCIEQCSDKTPFFSHGMGKFYSDNLDFMLRFWKNENYKSKPEITF